MKKKLSFIIGVLFCIIFICRVYILNRQYPQPSIQKASIGETIEFEDYKVCMVSWEWKDSKILKEMLSDYSILKNTDGTDYPEDKEKVAMVTLKIKKTGDNDKPFDMTSVTLESGGWHNQWSAVLYDKINGQDNYYLKLEKGESKRITIPVVLFDFQFQKVAWKSIGNRKFYVVLDNYPQKKMIVNQ